MGPTPTLYEQALQSVVTIIQDYDSDKQFPVLGFGAKIPPVGALNHEFFVTLSDNPYCAGVGGKSLYIAIEVNAMYYTNYSFFKPPGVIQAYRRCLPLVQLFGPTNFSPVIKHVTRFAAAHSNGEHFFVLLILTDGAISDMQDTKRVRIKCMLFMVLI